MGQKAGVTCSSLLCPLGGAQAERRAPCKGLQYSNSSLLGGSGWGWGSRVCRLAREAGLPIVVDADGLFVVNQNLHLIQVL